MRNRNAATFEGLQRIDHRDYPDTAIREALHNAIVHRDYAVSASTLLSVYSDRIEPISIGGLTGGISYDDMMLGISYCRNKKLADIFYRMGLIEAYGTGMNKIMSSYRNSPRKPEVTVTSGAFRFVLPNQRISAKMSTNIVKTPPVLPNGNRSSSLFSPIMRHIPARKLRKHSVFPPPPHAEFCKK